MGRVSLALTLVVSSFLGLALSACSPNDPTRLRGASDASLSTPLSSAFRHSQEAAERRLAQSSELNHLIQVGEGPVVPLGHVVVREAGMTLSRLAFVLYGDANRWRELADANGLKDPNLIYLGQVLELK